MKRTKKLLAAVLACAFIITMTAACTNTGNGGGTDPGATAQSTQAPASTEPAAAPESTEPAAEGTGNDTLVIGTTDFSGVFNYLFYQSAYDARIIEAVGIGIYDTGPGGQMIEGACYYQTPELTYGADGKASGAVYTFKLKEGLVFSDGQPVTADDIIFTYKCLASPAYGGLATFFTLPIPGVMEYRYDDPNYAAAVEQIAAEAANIPEDVWVARCLQEATDDYDNTGYGPEGLIGDLELEITLEATDPGYRDAVIEAATAAYAAGAGNYMKAGLIAQRENDLTLAYVDANMASGEKVKEIEGIKKIDDLTVQVTTNKVDRTAENQLAGIIIMPKHYYEPGTTKTDFDAIKAKNKAPLGAGPYVFDSYVDNVVTLHANPLYYGGEPSIKNVIYQAIPTTDQAQAAANGIVDVMEVSCNETNIKLLEDNGKYPYIFDRNGWGYIGVSGKATPDINVRKGIMHSMNRDLGVKTYYNDLAVVLERPITKASWGYPEGMDERVYPYDMAKAQQYFEAAGYSIKDGKMVDANGKQLHIDGYTSSQEHPIIPLYTQMKNDLDAIGVDFQIQEMDWPSLQVLFRGGDAQIWAAAYGDGSPDPDCEQYFHSRNIPTKNNPYYTSNPELDQLIDDAKLILDYDEARKVYAKIFDLVMDTATVMPYYQRMEMYSINPDVVDVDSLIEEPDPFYNFNAALLNGQLRLK